MWSQGSFARAAKSPTFATANGLRVSASAQHELRKHPPPAARDPSSFESRLDTTTDENFELRHTGPGVLTSSNRGPNSNGTQFGICLDANAWLDGRHVVFGKVVKGYSVVQAIEALGSEPHGVTSEKVIIKDCGELKPTDPSFLDRDRA